MGFAVVHENPYFIKHCSHTKDDYQKWQHPMVHVWLISAENIQIIKKQPLLCTMTPFLSEYIRAAVLEVCTTAREGNWFPPFHSCLKAKFLTTVSPAGEGNKKSTQFYKSLVNYFSAKHIPWTEYCSFKCQCFAICYGKEPQQFSGPNDHSSRDEHSQI